MKHQKRQKVPKTWPIPRKGTKFVVKTSSKGIPILVTLRDILKIAQTRKEVKKAISKKDLLVCGKPVKNEKKELFLFDVLTIIPSKQNYRLNLSKKGKFSLEEISEKERNIKFSKIINKKILKKKKS